MPNATFTQRYIDRDGDTRQFSLPGAALTAANFDAQVALWATLRGALNDVSLCANTSYAVGNATETGDVQPTNAAAQANIEFKVTYYYDSDPSVKRSVRIPGADLTLTDVLLPASNICDLSQTEIAALVSAFEAVVKEDSGTGSVTVESVEFLE